jgi:hypothetical protein
MEPAGIVVDVDINSIAEPLLRGNIIGHFFSVLSFVAIFIRKRQIGGESRNEFAGSINDVAFYATGGFSRKDLAIPGG